MENKKAKILYGCLLSGLIILLAGIVVFLFEYANGYLVLSQQSRLYIFLILGIVIGIFSAVTALLFTRNLEWSKRRAMAWTILAATFVVNGFFGIFDLVGTAKEAIPLVVYSFSITMGSLAFGFLFSKPCQAAKRLIAMPRGQKRSATKRNRPPTFSFLAGRTPHGIINLKVKTYFRYVQFKLRNG